MRIRLLLQSVVAGVPLAMCTPAGAADAASLLAAPDDGDWSLEAMVAAGRANRVPEGKAAELYAADANQVVKNDHSRHDTRDSELNALRRQIRSLKAGLADARRDLNKSTRESALVAAPDADVLVKARADLKDSEERARALSMQVESLKAGLAERDDRLRALAGPQVILHRDLSQKTAALNDSRRELASLRAEVAKQTAQIAALTPPPGEKDRVESLTLALEDRDKALASALSQADESRAALDRLKSEIQKKEKVTKDLTAALDVRSQELKEAATSLADLRAKRAPTIPATPQQKQAYVAGLMMADGLNRRLESWAQAGVKTDMGLFRSGLEDGLAHTLRLKDPEASRVQAAFMKAVQNGVARQVTDAQKRLDDLAKGRDALKSENGITWYRERAGKTVTPGHAVKLSMTERVVGGREVSRVPALTLRPGDNVPAVVRDGMYLPGVGGEVVAYALARDVYGELPLPAGVQPWTVMEYHLKGEPQTTR